ncbi:oxidoreductase [Rhodococcus pseudokoreensis]|uniref:Oxidoreductase n=1 Tax=Rhodococcus pseudokoreensis TaxID=2811421 RepID=A0A974W9P1_9NOCA|nr:PDR/VanB family oxidoreductase [Rhodococcus pseudokoreensis]QSE93754.1 oxidoreductase [Rhodococcus pseudokoreensis]
MDSSHMMRVASVKSEAEEVNSLRLESPDGRKLSGWTPGAHIELTLPSGRVRQYSLHGDPADEHSYDIAVLRQESGRGGSVELHESLLAGEMVRVRGPVNRFPLRDNDEYLFIAGGIGITPIIPMVRDVQRRRKKWTLVYGGKTLTSMAFREHLSDISQGSVWFVAEDEHGRIDLKLVLDSAGSRAAVYCCGPSGLISSVEDACSERQMEFHFERFAANPEAGAASVLDGTTRSFEVELRRTGQVLRVAENQSILQAVREAIPDVPSSCEDGFCGSCETKVLGGIPEHNDSILSESERREGNTMMICVGRSRTCRLELDL